MSLRNSLLIFPLLASLLMTLNVRADDLETFLEQHNLQHLLAYHLESRLDSLPTDQKEEAFARLAGIYTALLETVTDPAVRDNLEARGRKLLASAPPTVTVALRIALMRGTYRAAEKIAENHRLRLATPEELKHAQKSLSDLLPELKLVRDQLKNDIERNTRRLSRAAVADASVINSESERLGRLLSQATFLNAWALYYQSWLHGRRNNADAAEVLFAEILDTGSSKPNPDDVTVDRRDIEPIARAILGMALCKSMTSSTATALAWIDLLNHPQTYTPLRRESPVWRIVIQLEAGDFDGALKTFRAFETNGLQPSLAALRLAAVHALEAKPDNRAARAVADWVLIQLATRGELQQILLLADKYGAESLGSSGFALRYVRGVQLYQKASDQHGQRTPTGNDALRDLYGQALFEFQAALGESDAAQFAPAAARCTWLIAWCRYLRSEFLQARDHFLEAARKLPPDDAPDALWMAIVCLDRVLQSDSNVALAAELSTLIDEFLEAYPSSEHAPQLIIKRLAKVEHATPAEIRQLLDIPANADAYGLARHRAASLLYQNYRDASAADRPEAARAYLQVALPLTAAESLATGAAASDVNRLLLQCRRVLDVALTDGVNDLPAARLVFDRLDELVADGVLKLDAVRDEIDYRRFKYHLLGEDVPPAEAISETLRARDPDSQWSRLTVQALFRFGVERWRADRTANAASAQFGVNLDLITRYGDLLLQQYADRDDPLADAAALAQHALVAEAAASIYLRTGNLERGRLAIDLYDKLLAKRPLDGNFLYYAALLAEKLGPTEKAINWWRTIVNAGDAGSERWYEAKFHLITMLAASDPSSARAIMDQHKALYPEIGPEPWRSRYQALDRRLGSSSQPVPSESDDAEPAPSEPAPPEDAS